ncbi:hypothetical protein PROFUN_16524 [Planoprotostelium fungivorum]|uniref:Reverse transcriptase domain-containing protein n=1 Tax=Planoprotostelium fungivorum TaxID=1890364 RepID=A0A2P6MQ03_9EUKA|nr:hypothetical protein PROFUN_16524 [Planoprotostelium fungivorum]
MCSVPLKFASVISSCAFAFAQLSYNQQPLEKTTCHSIIVRQEENRAEWTMARGDEGEGERSRGEDNGDKTRLCVARHANFENYAVDDEYAYAFVYSADCAAIQTTTTTKSKSLNPENEISSIYKDFANVFSDGLRDLPEHGIQDLSIELKDGKIPPFGPLYNMSEQELEIVQTYITDMHNKGLIRPTKSPCRAPIVFARKKDGSLRLCVDYRRLNDLTVRNVYPLPRIDEMVNRLAGSKIFTTLDLKDAYWLCQIRAGDEWKSAFRTRFGMFEYLMMPFGLSNTPGNFQTHVNRCFHDMLDIFVQIYLDDFLIFRKSEEEHVEHVTKVLQRCCEHALPINLRKCCFHQESVKFLGYRIDSTGVHMIEDCVARIMDWEPPKDVKLLQSFCGVWSPHKNQTVQ